MQGFCECGCGQKTRIADKTSRQFGWIKGEPLRFIRGHNSKSNHPMLGKRHSDESRKKMQESHNGYQSGEGHPMYGKKHSKKARKKMSASHKGVALSEKHCASIGATSKRAWASKSKEDRKQWAKNISESLKGRRVGKKWRERNSRAKKKAWQDPEYAKKCLSCNSPNKCETKLMNMLESKYPGEWKFVGDGQVIIDGKCPDFINVNGQKKIIELFGERWHEPEEEASRPDIFRPFGYETLIVWVKELDSKKNLSIKLDAFCDESSLIGAMGKGGVDGG